MLKAGGAIATFNLERLTTNNVENDKGHRWPDTLSDGSG
jgi:hypothetical protein